MSRLKLDDVEWKKFRIRDVFKVENSKPYHKDNLKSSNVGIPYITRTSINNGLEDIIEFDRNFVLNKGNAISLGAENTDFFYHKYDYVTGNKMYRIHHDNINKLIGLFLVQVFKSSIKGAGFGYGKGLTGTRFKDRVILLPVDNNNSPNWLFMENYAKQEMKSQAEKIVDYYEKKLIDEANILLDLEVAKWNNFKVGEIFNFERKPSKGFNYLKPSDKGVPYLGATNRNNGVLDFVEREEDLIYPGNGIAFIRNGEGSMGYSVYKREEFIATQDISVGYNVNLDQYNGKFISTISDKVRGKYNFGYKRNQNRLENEILTLPTDKNGNPNWKYMTEFIKSLESETTSKVLEHIYIYIYIYI